MISINEQKTVFSSINSDLYEKVSQFFDKLKQSGISLSELSTSEIKTNGFNPNNIYFLKEGNVAAELEDKNLYIYEAGDIILPYSTAEDISLYYVAKSEVKILCLSLDDLFSMMGKHSELIALWFSINSLIQIQLNQMLGTLTIKEERANPGFGRYKAGMKIINEDDDADFVYSVSEGVAVAIHNGVEVGEIHQDEIFGAIAVLTDQKRTASVFAKTDCTVLMVHKDEFSKMVHSHPKLFLNILSSLAEKITSLNKKVSSSV